MSGIRQRWIEAGARAIDRHGPTWRAYPAADVARDAIAAVVPLIRAELRDRIEGLPHADCCPAAVSDYGHCECPLKDVLDLLEPPLGQGPNRMEAWL